MGFRYDRARYDSGTYGPRNSALITLPIWFKVFFEILSYSPRIAHSLLRLFLTNLPETPFELVGT
jgi:hypothetical protein